MRARALMAREEYAMTDDGARPPEPPVTTTIASPEIDVQGARSATVPAIQARNMMRMASRSTVRFAAVQRVCAARRSLPTIVFRRIMAAAPSSMSGPVRCMAAVRGHGAAIPARILPATPPRAVGFLRPDVGRRRPGRQAAEIFSAARIGYSRLRSRLRRSRMVARISADARR